MTGEATRAGVARGETELRGHLGFSGAGRAWHDLPLNDYAKARAKLTEMLRMADLNARPRKQLAVPNVA